MRKLLSHNAWLVVLTIAVNITGRFMSEDFTYPVGRWYQDVAGYLCSHNMCLAGSFFADAANRFLSPDYAYFLADAFSWLLIAIYTLRQATGYARIACMLFVGVTANNVLDELIFNPYLFDWNEMAVAAIVLLICGYEYRALKRAG